MIMQTEQSHDLLCTSWRPRENQWCSPIPPWRPENQESNSISSDQRLKAWQWVAPRVSGEGCPSSSTEHRFVLSPFLQFGLSIDWMVPTHLGKDDHLYSVYEFKCWFQPQTPSQKYPEVVSQLFRHPLAQSSRSIKSTITPQARKGRSYPWKAHALLTVCLGGWEVWVSRQRASKRTTQELITHLLRNTPTSPYAHHHHMVGRKENLQWQQTEGVNTC